jgi:lipopolysaccharide biosynthesis protein
MMYARAMHRALYTAAVQPHTLALDASLRHCRTAFELLDTMHTGKSEFHVEAPQRLERGGRFKARLTAYYLPQFHRLEVNDRAWGSGFTEWTNVTRTQPFFPGHLQPHLPADLGFYDLTNADVMRRQIDLALHYGVTGFCFYHYWFAGRTIMDGPVRLFQQLADPDMEFCLCWANENWSRRWENAEDDVIIRQEHSVERDRLFIHDILPYLRNDRYRRIEGRKLLLVYIPEALGAGLHDTVAYWRRIAREEGVGELAVMGTSFPSRHAFRDEPAIDGIVQFPPHRGFRGTVRIRPEQMLNTKFKGRIDDYGQTIAHLESVDYGHDRVIPGVFPAWDNSARKRERSHIFINTDPLAFERWLRHAIAKALQNPRTDGLVFINAWNEWAEGAHLEPCRWYGHAHLAACRRALLASEPTAHVPPQ